MKAYRGRRVIAPLILDLGTRQRRMVSITTECFIIDEEHPYQFSGRLSAPQTLKGSFGGGEKSLVSAGIQNPYPPARSLAAMLRLHNKSDYNKHDFCELVVLR